MKLSQLVKTVARDHPGLSITELEQILGTILKAVDRPKQKTKRVKPLIYKPASVRLRRDRLKHHHAKSADAAYRGVQIQPVSGVSSRTARARPTRSIPSEKSAATHHAPERASDTVETPVPAARSRTRSPGARASASRVRARQRRSCPAVSTVLVRS